MLWGGDICWGAFSEACKLKKSLKTVQLKELLQVRCAWNGWFGRAEGNRNQWPFGRRFCLVAGMSQQTVKNMILVIYGRYLCSFILEIVLPDITSCIMLHIHKYSWNAIKYDGFHGFMMFMCELNRNLVETQLPLARHRCWALLLHGSCVKPRWKIPRCWTFLFMNITDVL